MLTSAAREGPALEPQQQAVPEVAAPELGLVELRVDIVVIENEALAEQLEEPRDQKDGIGRIAGVDDVEAAASRRSRSASHEFQQQRQAYSSP